MKVLNAYTLDYLKRNKRSTIAIIISIIIATTMLSGIVFMTHNMCYDLFKENEKKFNDYHASFYDTLDREQIEMLKTNGEVADVQLCSMPYLIKIQNSQKPYLYIQNVDESALVAYKFTDIQGRLPQNATEIMVTTQFLENSNDVGIGDEITLPIYYLKDDEITSFDKWQDTVVFDNTQTKTFKIVASYDNSTRSYLPFYNATGYLDNSNYNDFSKYQVNVKLNSPSKTYKTMPMLAEQIGLRKDEQSGEYKILYNQLSLLRYFAFPDNFMESYALRQLFNNMILFLVIGIIVMLLFVFIIYNSFSVSANARIKQLGVFKSVGATPKQIMKSITFEAFILSIIGIPIGIVLGYFFLDCYIFAATRIDSQIDDFQTVVSIFSILLCILISWVTVWVSAIVPARKLSKTPIITAIHNGSLVKPQQIKFKNKTMPILKDISYTTFNAYKKIYRVTIISLSLATILFFTCINGFAVMNLNMNKFSNTLAQIRDIDIYLSTGKEEDSIYETLKKIEGVDTVYLHNTISIKTKINSASETEQLSAIGGLQALSEDYKTNIDEINGEYYVSGQLIGIHDEIFDEYCDALGVDSKAFYNESYEVIAISSMVDKEREIKRLPFTNINTGETLEVYENFSNQDGYMSYEFEVAEVTSQYPIDIIPIYEHNYAISYVMPMTQYYDIINQFESTTKQIRAKHTEIYIKAESKDIIEQTAKAIDTTLKDTYYEEDINISDTVSDAQRDTKVKIWLSYRNY